MSTHPIQKGMRLVLCTDGVWDYGGQPFLKAAPKGDPISAVKEILTICYDAGAPDNVTLIIADVE